MPTPLWLALAFPSLALQRAQRALAPALARTLPLAIVDGPVQRREVLACNGAARDAGIQDGMKLAAAQALCHGLTALPRHAGRDHEALLEIATWAGQFTPVVILAPPQEGEGIVLETGASERLFGGRAALRRRIARSLALLGFEASAGLAPTARGAWWLARARLRGLSVPDTFDLAALGAALAPLPLDLPGWGEATVASLRSLGLSCLGEARALPRDSFARRFGPRVLDDIDRALGLQPDPQSPYEPPERFLARIELPADLTDGAQLGLAARRLLASLEGWLRAGNRATTRIVLRAHHGARRSSVRPPTVIELALALPERDAGRIGRLLDERLGRVALAAPARELELAVDRTQAFAARNASLLPEAAHAIADPAALREGRLQLAQTLCARLGEHRVFCLQAVDDHRPECSYRVLPLGEAPAAQAPGLAGTGPRPLLLLPVPRPLAPDTPMALLAGPERIETGWWEVEEPGMPANGDEPASGPATPAAGRGVRRDYFVARDGRGRTLWIYLDPMPPGQWFLHGLFA